MSKPINIHDGTGRIIDLPGVGTVLAVFATSTAAGTYGFMPGGILLTTTTNKVYTNTGTYAAATWTVTGTQS